MKVLVVAAHPDDEVLGCGGTIAWHANQGDEVQIYIMAEGATSRMAVPDRTTMSTELAGLRKAAQQAATILGATVSFDSYPDNRMDSIDLLEIVKSVEEVVTKYKPNRIYTHHSGDLNIDHRIVHQAVVTACRPTPMQCVKSLLFFETPSSTEWQLNSQKTFNPNWFVPIGDSMDKKQKALLAYANEMREFPHPRSIEAIEHLARWRGACVGTSAAEAFILGRMLA